MRLAKSKKLKIAVGYNLRFSPGLVLAKKLIDSKTFGDVLYVRAEFGQSLPDWRPTLDYRKNYTARKKMGGGILLDGSHEVDYLRWILGDIKELTCVARQLGNLVVDTESIAELIVRFDHNVLGSIHVDFLRPAYNRRCEFICDNGMILWNYSDQEVKTFNKKINKWKTYHFKQEANYMYIQEVKGFLDSIRYNKKNYTNISEGAKTLKVVLEAKRSSKSGKIVSL
jgi:predicted dehydrogenase